MIIAPQVLGSPVKHSGLLAGAGAGGDATASNQKGVGAAQKAQQKPGCGHQQPAAPLLPRAPSGFHNVPATLQ